VVARYYCQHEYEHCSLYKFHLESDNRAFYTREPGGFGVIIMHNSILAMYISTDVALNRGELQRLEKEFR